MPRDLIKTTLCELCFFAKILFVLEHISVMLVMRGQVVGSNLASSR